MTFAQQNQGNHLSFSANYAICHLFDLSLEVVLLKPLAMFGSSIAQTQRFKLAANL